MMHFIPGVDLEEIPDEELDGIEIAMKGTEWAEMSFGGHFAYDDFTAVKHVRLKGYQPVTAVRYNRKEYYIYIKRTQTTIAHKYKENEYEFTCITFRLTSEQFIVGQPFQQHGSTEASA